MSFSNQEQQYQNRKDKKALHFFIICCCSHKEKKRKEKYFEKYFILFTKVRLFRTAKDIFFFLRKTLLSGNYATRVTCQTGVSFVKQSTFLILYYLILFYFILFYFILFYFILFYFIFIYNFNYICTATTEFSNKCFTLLLLWTKTCILLIVL